MLARGQRLGLGEGRGRLRLEEGSGGDTGLGDMTPRLTLGEPRDIGRTPPQRRAVICPSSAWLT